MSFVTGNILDFYKLDKETIWYLKKYFAINNHYGSFEPYTKDPILKEPNGNSFVGTVDEHNEYNINKFGLRGVVDEDSETLASGCSLTFGIGVPEAGRWTELLGIKINKNIMNLGSPGASVETICTNLIQYSLNNKMPKEIFCLMPDFFRRRAVVDKDFFKQKNNKKRVITNKSLNLEYIYPTITLLKDQLFMEVENQEYIEDSVSPHQLILNSINAIYSLEAFCLSNNIKLNWSTWDLPSQRIMEQLVKLRNFKLKNSTPFFPPDCVWGAGDFVINTCQLSHNSEYREHKDWLDGSDYSIIDHKKTKRFCHPGIHFHTHMAEFFDNLHNKNVIEV